MQARKLDNLLTMYSRPSAYNACIISKSGGNKVAVANETELAPNDNAGTQSKIAQIAKKATHVKLVVHVSPQCAT